MEIKKKMNIENFEIIKNKLLFFFFLSFFSAASFMSFLLIIDKLSIYLRVIFPLSFFFS